MPRRRIVLPDRLALDLYAAALDDEPLDAPLHAIAAALGAEMMLAHRFEPDGATHAGFVVSRHIPLDALGDYASHWIGHDPWVAPWMRRGPGVVNLSELVPPEALRRSAFWNEFLLPRVQTFHGLALRIDETASDSAYLNFWRRPASDAFGKDEAALLGHLARDVARALRARSRLAGAARSLTTLDALRDGVAVFDAAAQLRIANTALRVMTAEADGLTLTARGLVAADRVSHAALSLALAVALRGTHPAQPTVLVPRLSGGAAWRIEALPVPRGTEGLLGGDAGAVLLVRDTAYPPMPAEPMLARLFGLTAAEAALAVSLLGGRSVAEHAQARRISPATARTHLGRLLDKTGCRRQAELVARLAPLAH